MGRVTTSGLSPDGKGSKQAETNSGHRCHHKQDKRELHPKTQDGPFCQDDRHKPPERHGNGRAYGHASIGRAG